MGYLGLRVYSPADHPLEISCIQSVPKMIILISSTSLGGQGDLVSRLITPMKAIEQYPHC